MADATTQAHSAGQTGAESTRNVPVFAPPADIYETNDALVVSLEMPGVEPDGVNVTLEKRVLTITGRGKPEQTAPQGRALVHGEYRSGDYERVFTLSEVIDSEQIEAAMKDGVLKLTLPKAKPAPAKTISVKAG